MQLTGREEGVPKAPENISGCLIPSNNRGIKYDSVLSATYLKPVTTLNAHQNMPAPGVWPSSVFFAFSAPQQVTHLLASLKQASIRSVEPILAYLSSSQRTRARSQLLEHAMSAVLPLGPRLSLMQPHSTSSLLKALQREEKLRASCPFIATTHSTCSRASGELSHRERGSAAAAGSMQPHTMAQVVLLLLSSNHQNLYIERQVQKAPPKSLQGEQRRRSASLCFTCSSPILCSYS